MASIRSYVVFSFDILKITDNDRENQIVPRDFLSNTSQSTFDIAGFFTFSPSD